MTQNEIRMKMVGKRVIGVNTKDGKLQLIKFHDGSAVELDVIVDEYSDPEIVLTYFPAE